MTGLERIKLLIKMNVFGNLKSLTGLKLLEKLSKRSEGGYTDKQTNKITRVENVPISMWFYVQVRFIEGNQRIIN